MPFEPAGAAEILRATQKDDSFLDYIKSCVADIIQRSVGTRAWLELHRGAEVVCELVYLSLTTLSLRQTLGEEYTGILQVDSSRTGLPHTTQRVAMVVLQCFGPMVVKRLLSLLESSSRTGWLSGLRPELRSLVLQHSPTLRHLLTLLHRLHLATFYLNGAFYHIAKRLTGIRYVLVRDWLGDNAAQRSFRVLGLVMLTHSLLSATYSTYTHWCSSSLPEKQPVASNCYVDIRKQCPLCLEERQHPSLTPCGHLFCWQCIHDSLAANPQCPLCRHPATHSQVVPLQNYH